MTDEEDLLIYTGVARTTDGTLILSRHREAIWGMDADSLTEWMNEFPEGTRFRAVVDFRKEEEDA